MNRGRMLGLLAFVGLVLTACQNQNDDEETFGKRVRAYLLSHPEMLQEMSQRLDARLASAEDANRQRAASLLPSLREAIERDPADFVANPGAAITVTEFYDYRCPHCAAAAPKVVALIKANPDVRLVFKEMPIFGPTSEHAARAALAVKNAGGDALGLYTELMATHALDDGAIDRIALRRGARPIDLAPGGLAAATAHIAATASLFSKLSLEGTPAFIVGNQIILGEDMAAVGAAVARVQAKGVWAGRFKTGAIPPDKPGRRASLG